LINKQWNRKNSESFCIFRNSKSWNKRW